MAQQELSIPVQCDKCEGIFDLSYDLKEEYQVVSDQVTTLCWECRPL